MNVWPQFHKSILRKERVENTIICWWNVSFDSVTKLPCYQQEVKLELRYISGQVFEQVVNPLKLKLKYLRD